MPALTHVRPSAPSAIAAKAAIRLARLSSPRNAGARDHIRSPAKTAITPACLVGASRGRPYAESRKAARMATPRSGPTHPPSVSTLRQLCVFCVLCGGQAGEALARRESVAGYTRSANAGAGPNTGSRTSF
jgi:hypothetical protein